VVPVKESEKMVYALKACGGRVEYTVYPEAGHDSWTETYANPALYEWFLEHRRGRDGDHD
jgi:dipeptidyl aminopeptidase/acylaminoacyl peptidase